MLNLLYNIKGGESVCAFIGLKQLKRLLICLLSLPFYLHLFTVLIVIFVGLYDDDDDVVRVDGNNLAVNVNLVTVVYVYEVW